MKKLNFQKSGGVANRNAFRGGSYSLTISIVVLAILIVVNIFASALPTAVTKYDISASKLYSITSNTKVVVNALEQDVTIYWVVQSGQEDPVIENLLGKYDSLSGHIQVVKKNPDVYPTFAEQYTDETVRNNSLIVECGDRSRFIGYDDIYVQEADIYSYSYNTSFDGEGAITSAIDYVVSEEFPQLYILEGHEEADLPASFQEQIEKENMETQALSLLTVDTIPEDADCLVIYAPESDLSQEEKERLADYAAEGGKLFVVAGPVQDGILENLYSLLADYGVQANEGIVVEGDRNHYNGFLRQGPMALLPDMNSDTITDPLIDEKYHPIMPISLGLTVLILVAGEALIAMFGLTQESVTIGGSFFRTIASFYLVYSLAMALRGYLEGMGDMIFSGAAGIAALAVRIACSYAFAGVFGRKVIAYAEAFSWLVLLGVYLLRYIWVRRRERRK